MRLLDIYRQTLSAVSPDTLIKDALPRLKLSGRTDVLAVGKAAALMAWGVQEQLGDSLGRGFLLTKDRHIPDDKRERLAERFELREAAHPVPNQAGFEAAREIVEWLQGGKEHLLVLFSGGASSLLVYPSSPLELDDLREINSALLMSGFPIEEINILRKHLSEVKGGQLAARAGSYAGVSQLVMVDICAPQLDEDEIFSLVGSGPFVADRSTVDEARELLEKLKAGLSSEIYRRAEHALHETPDQSEVKSLALASHVTLREKASALIELPLLAHPEWTPDVTGEVREVAANFAEVARALKKREERGVLVASGEPTVKIETGDPGRGGRCQELALHFARAVAGTEGVSLLAGSSDGTDGPTEDAGALVTGRTWPDLCMQVGEERAVEMLESHDAGNALAKLDGALLTTGPTGQNINDIYLLRIEP